MRIVLVTYYFPPFNAVASVRVGKLAQFWVRSGFDVRILSAADVPLARSLDQEVDETLVRRTPAVNVNWLPELVAGGRRKIALQGYSTIAGNTVAARLGHWYRSLINCPDGQIGWLPYAVAEGRKLVKEFRPQVIYASAPPFTGLIVAKLLAREGRVPWVAEFRDLWTDGHAYRYGRVRLTLERTVERLTLRDTAGLVTVSDYLAGILRDAYSKPTETVMNGFDPHDYRQDVVRQPDAALTIVYTGMVYQEHQNIEPLFRAVARLRDGGIPIQVRMFGRYLAHLKRDIREAGIADCVSIFEVVDHATAIEEQQRADVLLYLTWRGRHCEGVLSGKIFEYLGTGNPILAVGPFGDGASRLMRDRGVGFISESPEEIAAYLESVNAAKREAGCSRPAAEHRDLTRDEQFKRLTSFLMGIVKPSAAC